MAETTMDNLHRNCQGSSELKSEADDVYDTRCGEVFITLNHILVFHCSLCNRKYGSFECFVEHLSIQHYEKIREQEQYATKRKENKSDMDQASEGSDNTENESLGQPLDETLHEYDELKYTHHIDIAERYASGISDQVSQSESPLNAKDYLEEIENIVILHRPYCGSDERLSREKLKMEEKITSEKRRQFPRLPSSTDIKRTFIHTNVVVEKPIKRKRVGLFKCDICSKTFTHRDNLKKHLITHSSERKHKCEHCGFAFKDPSNLKSHVLRCHTGQKHFGCDFCSKKFFTKTESKAHMRTHTRENPYICSFCGLGFQTASRMTAHSRRHTMKAPLQCSYCNKDFWEKGELKDHLLVHTKEKPFACPICSARFPRRKSMLRHTKLHEK